MSKHISIFPNVWFNYMLFSIIFHISNIMPNMPFLVTTKSFYSPLVTHLILTLIPWDISPFLHITYHFAGYWALLPLEVILVANLDIRYRSVLPGIYLLENYGWGVRKVLLFLRLLPRTLDLVKGFISMQIYKKSTENKQLTRGFI